MPLNVYYAPKVCIRGPKICVLASPIFSSNGWIGPRPNKKKKKQIGNTEVLSAIRTHWWFNVLPHLGLLLMRNSLPPTLGCYTYRPTPNIKNLHFWDSKVKVMDSKTKLIKILVCYECEWDHNQIAYKSSEKITSWVLVKHTHTQSSSISISTLPYSIDLNSSASQIEVHDMVHLLYQLFRNACHLVHITQWMDFFTLLLFFYFTLPGRKSGNSMSKM